MGWFNPTHHNPEISGAQMPLGKYRVRIIKTTKRENQNKTGGLLDLNLGVLDGPNAGQSGNLALNIWSATQQAAEIAARHFAAICQVCGVHGDLNGMPEGVELWGKDFMIEIVPQADSKYVQIGAIFDINGKAPVAWSALGINAAQAAPPPPAAAPPAWQAPTPAPAPLTAGPPASPAPAWQAPPAATPAPAWQQASVTAPAAAPAWAR